MGESWYVVEAFEGRDEDVALRLCAAGLKAWRPVDTVRTTKREKLQRSGRPSRKIVKRARFGRYLFLRAELENPYVLRAVKDMRGVKDFLCAAGAETPAPIPDELIDFYRENMPARPSKQIDGVIYEVGDVVRILAGPFMGFDARIESIDKGGVLRVEVELFGRPTPLPIEVGHVEFSGAGRRPPKISTSKRCAGVSA